MTADIDRICSEVEASIELIELSTALHVTVIAMRQWREASLASGPVVVPATMGARSAPEELGTETRVQSRGSRSKEEASGTARVGLPHCQRSR
jgi:hypothetical protein